MLRSEVGREVDYGFVDYDAPAPGERNGRRRMRRQRLLETALPCVLLAGVIVALLFTVGHLGASARNMARRSRLMMAKANMVLLSEEEHRGRLLQAEGDRAPVFLREGVPDAQMQPPPAEQQQPPAVQQQQQQQQQRGSRPQEPQPEPQVRQLSTPQQQQPPAFWQQEQPTQPQEAAASQPQRQIPPLSGAAGGVAVVPAGGAALHPGGSLP